MADFLHGITRLVLMLFQYECSMRGTDTSQVSTGPLFDQLEILSFAKVKIVTIDYKIRASALYLT